jgi:hypothetical protein
MTDKENKSQASNRVTDQQRLRYIGFDVFPGKPKDLFKGEGEKRKFVDRVLEKRDQGELLRDQCTLVETRVSAGEKLVLAITSVLIIATLFLPWFSIYNEVEVVDEVVAPVEEVVEEAALMGDSLLDSMELVAGEGVDNQTADAVTEEIPVEGDEGVADMASEGDFSFTEESDEEIITGMIQRRELRKDYERLSGLGAFASLGSVGSSVFSSSGIVIITALVFLLYLILALALPILNLYVIYGSKGSEDEIALKLKRYLRLNWLPLILFFAAMILSFMGGSYGFDSGAFSSLGDTYGVGVFLDTLSYGVVVSISAFVLLAAKGIEI